ncbi:hypothetical protein HW555_011214 [Spodoptera exigua]|uniref:Uncharacterized protein n=1 Tax=Spodoptera exigua TaxID=7107 RepID=A0A835G849_SPOEX|nr:hypothetical protein HW555_011214 [Spodoptera exigua]
MVGPLSSSDTWNAEGAAILVGQALGADPVHDSVGKARGELQHVLHGETVHVEDDDSAADLCLRLQHGGFQEQHAPLEHLLIVPNLRIHYNNTQERTRSHSPSLRNSPTKLVACGENSENILDKDVGLLAGDEAVVVLRVFQFETVVTLDLKDGDDTSAGVAYCQAADFKYRIYEGTFRVELAGSQEPDEPGLTIHRH